MRLQSTYTRAKSTRLRLNLLAYTQMALLQCARHDGPETRHAKDTINGQTRASQVAADGGGIDSGIKRGQQFWQSLASDSGAGDNWTVGKRGMSEALVDVFAHKRQPVFIHQIALCERNHA
jgi:hypothetical protein